MSRLRIRLFAMSIATVWLLQLTTGETDAAPPAFHDQVSSGNPVLSYQLSETAGNAVNFGSLGTSHDAAYFGTVNRAASTIGGDTGVSFNSSDDYLESLGVSSLTGNPTFSIETLIFLPIGGSAGLWGPFLHWGDGGGGNGDPQRTGREVYFSVQNANLNRTYAGFYNAGQRTASPVPLGEWLHIVWTRVGGNDSAAGTTLYINGTIVALEQDPNLNPGFLTSAGINVSSTAFHINRASDFFGTRHFTGTMDEIALYDRVLTANEVRDHACSIEALCGGIAGDFNANDAVDAADYTVWRDTLGSTTDLRANGDNTGASAGVIDQADYAVWKSHFGQTAGSAAAATASVSGDIAVPEPATVVQWLLAAAGGSLRRRRVT